MSLSNSEITHLLLAFVLLLTAAHSLGQLFAHLRQPRVAGEILGGLLLGPTLFGFLLPEWHATVFGGATTKTGLAIAYQLGLPPFLMRGARRHVRDPPSYAASALLSVV